jgi:hypothetical protein
MRKRTWRWWAGIAMLTALVAATGWYFLRPGDYFPKNETPAPKPASTPASPLAGVAAQTEADAAIARYAPKVAGRIDDLAAPAVDILKQLPFADKVEVLLAVEKPTARIIHVSDWHSVPKDLFAVDLENTHGRKFTGAELDACHAALLHQVEMVQVQQLGLLRCLAKHHGLKAVYQEGITQNQKAWMDQIEALQGIAAEYKKVMDQLQEVRQLQKTAKGERAKKAKGIEEELQTVRGQQLPLLLEVGAAGRMLLNKEIDVLPLDDEHLLDEAKPVTPAGKFKMDPAKVKSRQQAMVKAVLDRGSFGLVVLGASHDLSEVLQGRPCEYIRVWVKDWPG